MTLEAIIHDSSVSDGAIPASDQFGGSKADMLGYNCSAQCFKAWFAAHLTSCIAQSSRLNNRMTCSRYCNFLVLTDRKNTLITSSVGS